MVVDLPERVCVGVILVKVTFYPDFTPPVPSSPRSPYLGAGAWVINIDRVGNFHFLKHDQKSQPQG